jgi:hypothetical protein
MMPRIEILHVRDPDYDCVIEVYIDGRLLPGDQYHIEDVDPGRGYQSEDIQEHIDGLRGDLSLSLRFRESAIEAYTQALDSEYVD